MIMALYSTVICLIFAYEYVDEFPIYLFFLCAGTVFVSIASYRYEKLKERIKKLKERIKKLEERAKGGEDNA